MVGQMAFKALHYSKDTLSVSSGTPFRFACAWSSLYVIQYLIWGVLACDGDNTKEERSKALADHASMCLLSL